MNNTKYIILLPVPEPASVQIRTLMNEIAVLTGLPPPYRKLIPHITLHVPIVTKEEQFLCKTLSRIAETYRQRQVGLGPVIPFGKARIVLPLYPSYAVARLWIETNLYLDSLPQFDLGSFGEDNSLHVTVAAKTTPVFDSVWPKIQQLSFAPITFPLETVALYRKPEGGGWKEVLSLPLLS